MRLMSATLPLAAKFDHFRWLDSQPLRAGWSTDEFQATGATRADRGRVLNKRNVFDAVWGPDLQEFSSNHRQLPSIDIRWRPR
jgi:hypothetical protein